MGNDNLFHKRKERKAESLRRRRAQKSPYDVVLIVCEGGKTEPNYFAELKKTPYRINWIRPLTMPPISNDSIKPPGPTILPQKGILSIITMALQP